MAVRWGIIGCGDVTEVKSGPGFQQVPGSALVAVMRRDRAKAEDYARRHGVARAYDRAADLLADPEVDAVYIATPPSSHMELARLVADAGKPCLVEKPMAMNYGECLAIVGAFSARRIPLWVAYYRRALPRFLAVRERLTGGTIGRLTSVHVQVTERLAAADVLSNWRFDPAVGGGLFLDLASHCVDLLDFFAGPITGAHGFALNTGGAYPTADTISASFVFENGVVGTGVWNFNAHEKTDAIVLTGTRGTISTPIFTDGDVAIDAGGLRDVLPIRNPPHVHQPLIQSIVEELQGRGRCESTGESGARASWVLDCCLGRA
jgi:predicted dehydrogenase